MRGLLYKNFLLYRNGIIVIGCFQAIVSVLVLVMTSGNVFISETIMGYSLIAYFLVFLLSSLIEQQMFTPDEKRVVSGFIISAPGGAKGHIQSKYYTILIINLMVLNCCFMTDALACAIAGTADHSVGSLCMLFLCINLIFSAFSTPFYIRFGSVSGNGIKYGTLGAVTLVIGIYGLFGDISFLFGGDPMAAITEFLSSGNALLVLSLIPAVSVMLYYASYRISLLVYRKGAENYEQ